MRIPVKYSQHRIDIRGHRLGAIHIDLRRGRNAHGDAYLSHERLFRQYQPANAEDLHRWSQYLKRNYPEFRHDNPEPSS